MISSGRGSYLQKLLGEKRIDILVCALPANVLMLSGYWPVVGTGVAVAFSDRRIALLVPEDEAELAARGWADEVHTFRPGSLERLQSAAEAIRGPLTDLIGSATRARIGFEGGENSEPASYAAIHLYGCGMHRLLAGWWPKAEILPAEDIIASLRSIKTKSEIERLRTSCRIAGHAFGRGAASIATGLTETEVADTFRRPLSTWRDDFPEVERADGFAWCMSGANSALASGAYARSRMKKIAQGDLVLIHCNSYADGYWTDITRTFCASEPDDRQSALFDAVLQARQAALSAIRPGVTAASVDSAAREVLRGKGLADAFKHSTGHGVGFGAIDAGDLPRLHPVSPDVLETGMVFNVEPAVYFEGYGGLRHCDMVAVTETGYELLTPFQSAPADLRVT